MKQIIYLASALFFFSSSIHANELYSKILIQAAYVDTIPKDSVHTVGVSNDEGELMVFEKVDIEARFGGGDGGWRQFIINNLNPDVPVKKRAPAGTYTVVVQFIVNTNGAIVNVTALTKHGYGMEQEVIRMIKRSPKWHPAKQNGQSVNAYRKQPITFVVQEEVKKGKQS